MRMQNATAEQAGGSETLELPFILRLFRWLAAGIFVLGLAFVIIPSLILQYSSHGTNAGETQLYQTLAFAAGWIAFFVIFFRFTSGKRRAEPIRGRVHTFNMAASGRFMGFGFVALFSFLGWALLVEPYIINKERFHPILLLFIALFLAFWAAGMAMLFNVRNIRIDAGSRRYTFRAGIFPFVKERRGDISDFSHLLIKEEESRDSDGGSSTYYWTLNLVWKTARRDPFQLTQRPRGFEDLGRDPFKDICDVAANLSSEFGLASKIERLERPQSTSPDEVQR